MSVLVVRRSGESFLGESRKSLVRDPTRGIFNAGRCDELIDCPPPWNDESLPPLACFRKPPNRAPRPPEALDGLCAPGSRVPLSVEAGLGLVGDPSKREPMLVNLWDHDSVRIKDPLGLVVRSFEEERSKRPKSKLASDGCLRCDFDFASCDDSLAKLPVLVAFSIIGCVISSPTLMRAFIPAAETDGAASVARSSSTCKICVYNPPFGPSVVRSCIQSSPYCDCGYVGGSGIEPPSLHSP